MRLHYLQHVPFEDPGYIISWTEQNGHQLTGTLLFDDQELPSPRKIDVLVVMGGPMGVAEEEKYRWLRAKGVITRGFYGMIGCLVYNFIWK